ncbi:MAG: hypothetical protein EBY32_06900 [Proteobacteria bacterium]|nr:hypothetical protein [Pseudomonadota bacterium]
MLKFFCLSLLFASFALCATTRAAETKPNILFIFSDDHAQRLIGAYKGSINKTPNLDRIAHEGALFTNSFVTNSICCPSRASILTGKYSFANGVLTNSSSWDTTQWSYPRDIGKAGYQTALIGKWHMASAAKAPTTIPILSANPENPRSQGIPPISSQTRLWIG